MSNNKDFKVKNGIKPTAYHEALGTVSVSGSTATLDLSTGSVFDYTPTSDVQVTLTNPAASGTSSGATLLLGSEDSAGVSSTFSTTLYDGTATSESHRIQNGIDLAGDGGLVWIKKRDSNIQDTNHYLSDTERGNFYLASNSTNAQAAGDIASYNSDGWTFNASTGLGTDYNGSSYVSWTFKKQAKFFDIVTYTGDGTQGRQISHNLGSVPGMIIVKSTSATDSWNVYHRSCSDDNASWCQSLFLNSTGAEGGYGRFSPHASQTDTHFSFYDGGNTNGVEFVAYLFAHDTDASSLIKCGSYTHSSSSGNNISLGWEPQWLLVKSATSATNWYIWDTVRGWDATTQSHLKPNTNAAESTGSNTAAGWPQPTSTGFTVGTNNYMGDNQTYIYMAIRSPSVPTVTYDPNLQWSGGTAPTLPATGEKDVITFNTTDGGTTYKSALAIDGAK
jgi:hypothetical protein